MLTYDFCPLDISRTVVVAVDEKLILFDPKEQSKDFYFRGVKQSGERELKSFSPM